MITLGFLGPASSPLLVADSKVPRPSFCVKSRSVGPVGYRRENQLRRVNKRQVYVRTRSAPDSVTRVETAWKRSRSSRGVGLVTRAIHEFESRTKYESRVAKRDVFGQEDWTRHRSFTRYPRHLFSAANSKTFSWLLPAIATFSLIATGVVVFNHFGPQHFPSFPQPRIPMVPFSITTAALSLLLVFRTNASYDRWWEGRKLWGLLLIRSRDVVRQGLNFFSESEDEAKARLVRYVTAFNYALKVHLRGGEDLRTELEPVLQPDELEAAVADPHPPNHVLFVISTIVHRAEINQLQASRMDENLTTFSDILGACERILKTPIPLSYTRHTSRFLIVWLALLPFALVGDCGWLTIPVEAFIAAVLLGIEDIGVQIEEPFSILSLEAICKAVDTNNRSLYDQQKSVWKLAQPGAA